MALKIGGDAGPCPPCKIILNGGFMAVLAPMATGLFAAGSDAAAALNRLSLAADTYVKMLAVLGVAVSVKGDWEGCEQAQLLTQLIVSDWSPNSDQIEKFERWTRDLWSAIADLVAGKLPTG